ncbi:hypothetical protein [Stenotrophomonas sp. T8]|uniref:hypothetical protein n=1 Tax=Stenotrophomonas sp. T8 TaxID=3446365 RepID=UPI003F717697
MATKKRERFVSPKGTAVWPRLNEPDTKFKPEGEYTVSLAFDPNDKDFKALAKKLETRRDELFQEFLSENPKKKKGSEVAPVFTEETDENGDDTGRVLVKFKMKASGVSKRTGKKFTMRPDIFDARGKKIDNPPQIGGGSELKVSYEIGGSFVESAKKFYLTCYMVAVQVIELVEFGQRNAKDYGFGEEDGYEAADNAPFSDSDDDSDDDSDSDDEGDDGDY